jgi:hypothetical protein
LSKFSAHIALLICFTIPWSRQAAWTNSKL